jgi:hypothetical protein
VILSEYGKYGRSFRIRRGGRLGLEGLEIHSTKGCVTHVFPGGLSYPLKPCERWLRLCRSFEEKVHPWMNRALVHVMT